ncbi:hypothetical protein SDC9_54243 [bioreactor metagenome]|uniref:Uncharacterized protein n=1 Tax=bioreactor metagenome TaxID=1076179 RepID=A0A644WVU3_9ZZZZ
MTITFRKPNGSSYWVYCESMERDIDGTYLLDGVVNNSDNHGPCSGEEIPATWEIVKIKNT